MSASASTPYAIVTKAAQFGHEDASAISKYVLQKHTSRMVVIDLSCANDATTAAFATLVVLRRALLRQGGDLRVCGLRERAENVFNVNRLQSVLPSN